MNAPRLEKSQLHDEAGWRTRERALVLILAAATALAFFVCYLLVQPFVPVLAWALALAIVARPLHSAIASRVRNADLAAGLAVALVALLFILPALFVVRNLVHEAAAGADRLQAETQIGQWLENVEATPWVGPTVHWLRENADVRGALQQVAAYCIVSENIAHQYNSLGFTTEELAEQFVQGWKNSPGHRKKEEGQFRLKKE